MSGLEIVRVGTQRRPLESRTQVLFHRISLIVVAIESQKSRKSRIIRFVYRFASLSKQTIRFAKCELISVR